MPGTMVFFACAPAGKHLRLLTWALFQAGIKSISFCGPTESGEIIISHPGLLTRASSLLCFLSSNHRIGLSCRHQAFFRLPLSNPPSRPARRRTGRRPGWASAVAPRKGGCRKASDFRPSRRGLLQGRRRRQRRFQWLLDRLMFHNRFQRICWLFGSA